MIRCLYLNGHRLSVSCVKWPWTLLSWWAEDLKMTCSHAHHHFYYYIENQWQVACKSHVTENNWNESCATSIWTLHLKIAFPWTAWEWKKNSVNLDHDLEAHFVGCRVLECQIECEAWIKKGNPKDIICEEAQKRNPDLLVLGSRGLGTLQR
jgi:hypothetical protein